MTAEARAELAEARQKLAAAEQKAETEKQKAETEKRMRKETSQALKKTFWSSWSPSAGANDYPGKKRLSVCKNGTVLTQETPFLRWNNFGKRNKK